MASARGDDTCLLQKWWLTVVDRRAESSSEQRSLVQNEVPAPKSPRLTSPHLTSPRLASPRLAVQAACTDFTSEGYDAALSAAISQGKVADVVGGVNVCFAESIKACTKTVLNTHILQAEGVKVPPRRDHRTRGGWRWWMAVVDGACPRCRASATLLCSATLPCSATLGSATLLLTAAALMAAAPMAVADGRC